MGAAHLVRSSLALNDLTLFYLSVRQTSRSLGAPLSDADATVQSMADASPAKWHLAHTTWFFETMVLGPHLPGYRVFDESFNFLFNSYYETIGARQPRPRRGMISRPTLETIYAYRSHVDAAIEKLLARQPPSIVAGLIELGLGERIRAFHFDGILRGHHQKRRFQLMGGGARGHGALLHRLQPGGLRLGRGAINLVGQHQVGENGTVLEAQRLAAAFVALHDHAAHDRSEEHTS